MRSDAKPGSSGRTGRVRQFAHMEATLARHAHEVAAVIVEPLVQCAGGMRMYRPGVPALLREACNRHGVHLIADEIAVGFGRTGTMFACEQAGICPDFMCLSKGLTGGYLPLSAVLTADEIYSAFYDDYTKLTAFLHSHSYTGNPLACAAALATLDIFAGTADAGAQPRAGRHFARRARGPERSPARRRSPPARHDPRLRDGPRQGRTRAVPVAERRGLASTATRSQRGVLLRPIGNVIYFMPPYVIEPEHIELMAQVAREGMELATCA